VTREVKLVSSGILFIGERYQSGDHYQSGAHQ